MAAKFSFGFADEDIDMEVATVEEEDSHGLQENLPTQYEHAPRPAVQKHQLHIMLQSLPSKISYYSTVVCALDGTSPVLVPRRALFDMKVQMMAEAEMNTASTIGEGIEMRQRTPYSSEHNPRLSETQAELGASDIEQDVYEGGLKSWEGASDLARYLLSRENSTTDDYEALKSHVIELGCGTALPTLVLFQHCIARKLSTAFILADFNASVMRLATLSNLLLNWSLHFAPEAFDPAVPSFEFLETTEAQGRPSMPQAKVLCSDGDLHITPGLIESFLRFISPEASNPISFVSGPWDSPQFLEHIIENVETTRSALILAAETIYSHRSLSLFSELLIRLLSHIPRGKALVAAKRVYFGTGGSVEAFREALSIAGITTKEVHRTGISEASKDGTNNTSGGGLDRVILQAGKE